MSGQHLAEQYAFRDSITDAFLGHMLGPSNTTEVLTAPPLDVYSVGILYPDDSPMEEVLDDPLGEAATDEENVDENVVALANRQFPSSMGLSFAVESVESGAGAVMVNVAAGSYEKMPDGRWMRVDYSLNDLRVETGQVHADELEVADGLFLGWRVRPKSNKGHVTVTIYLVNKNRPQRDRNEKSAAAFFQPRIDVRPATSAISFVDRVSSEVSSDENEVLSSRLLYRHARSLAVGHGCAVSWDEHPNAVMLSTTFLPIHDLRRAESNPGINELCLDMRCTDASGRAVVLSSMRSMVDGYQGWIEARRREIGEVPEDLRETAERHLRDCSDSAERITTGIGILESDGVAWDAFVLMNRVMVLQRIRSERVLAGREVADDQVIAKWYPFQLCFILQCIPGLVNPESPDRQIADLLWFPTGGGKTEAYLGLIAFDLMIRRLRQQPRGVAALMRYTLRLLTVQQFERAALMICCCEHVRRHEPALGADRFEIGLYVGRKVTPNSLSAAKEALRLLMDNEDADVSKFGNPIQIGLCVWCGTRLGPADYSVETHCEARCPNTNCLFSGGLPWYVVDEDVFSRRPDLIIGTVDKFAMMALDERSGNIFNRLEGGDPGIDLVIQDELHLISGPLGTITGLYEVAIDALGTRRLADGSPGPRPKVIASTATIRRAGQQVRALFDRDVRQFPPQGLDARDSYFAIESPPNRKGTRRYIGLMAPGLSHTTALVRTYAVLLDSTARGDRTESIRDTYWTMVSYFNSLRVLASAQLLMIDDVIERMSLLAGGEPSRRPDRNLIELTSRASQREIPLFLRELRIPYPDSGTVEAMLATNMISVGVDIDRLGLMVIAGQPQTTAEYIQSSSRVGRRDPGLVVTVYNAARSRDKSHYETFLNYHSAFYRQVEGTSLTPFSPKARSRALAAALVIMCRFTVPGLRGDSDARNIRQHVDEVRDAAKLIVNRARRVDPVEAENVAAELDDFIDNWIIQADRYGEAFRYHDFGSSAATLLVTNEESDPTGRVVKVLMSMRDVDKTCNLYEINGGW